LAKRTRRDLTNKTIRKAIREKLKKGNHKTPQKSYSDKYLKPTFYALFIVFISVLTFKLIYSVDFNSFLSSETNHSISDAEERTATDEAGIPNTNKSESNQTEEFTQRKAIPVEQKTQIEVLNGCGADGIAFTATQYGRQKGLDVVSMGNHANFDVKKSYIVGWINDKDTIQQIAEIFGIDSKHVSIKENKDKQLAASIILGKDYKNLNPFKK
jgi:hypothetical protein